MKTTDRIIYTTESLLLNVHRSGIHLYADSTYCLNLRTVKIPWYAWSSVGRRSDIG